MISRACITIEVVEAIGSDVCTSYKDGRVVSDLIVFGIGKGFNITISFKGVRALSPAFLNGMSKCLCDGSIMENEYYRVRYENISPGRMLMLQKAIEEGRVYYSNPRKPALRPVEPIEWCEL